MLYSLPRIVLAGVASGVGKTTLTTALLASLHSSGMRVQPFKVGPDYLDPSHLAAAAGLPCYNLDTWMMSPDRVLDMFCTVAVSAELAVIEGMMGLYDGEQSTNDVGSTAALAKLLHAPVVLILDAWAMARSAAAVVMGFQQLDPQLHLAGVIANRVGSAAHARLIQEAIASTSDIPFLGYFPHNPAIALPERHLGLVPVVEQRGMDRDQHLAALGLQFRQTCHQETLLALARATPPLAGTMGELFLPREKGTSSVRIALAHDEAFTFYYADALDALRQAGAELVPFSPLHDRVFPERIAGIYIGGGFPEEYAQDLSTNEPMRIVLAQLIEQDIPCYAECGGLMYLCKSMRDASGRVHPMVGAIARQSIMNPTQSTAVIGYREVTALRDTLLLHRGDVVRGHEFHFSHLDGAPTPEEAAYEVMAGGLAEGFARGNLLASYVHLPLGGIPLAAQRFVDAARIWLEQKKS